VQGRDIKALAMTYASLITTTQSGRCLTTTNGRWDRRSPDLRSYLSVDHHDTRIQWPALAGHVSYVLKSEHDHLKSVQRA
jgi:hypothetical protein